MVQKDFNSIETDRGTLSLEHFISQIESRAAPIVRRIIDTKAAGALSADDREILFTFVALQFIRGTGHRAQFQDIAGKLRDELERRGIPPEHNPIRVPDDKAAKLAALHGIATAIPEFSQHLRSKDIVVFKAPPDHEFIIGDNPVVMDNHREFRFGGNLGLAVPGIEIYLPLNAQLTLGLWAPDLVNDIRATIRSARKARDEQLVLRTLGAGTCYQQTVAFTQLLDSKIAYAENLLREVESGGPVLCDVDNMDRFNSMQVVYAERYLASASGRFDLAKRMLDAMPDLRDQGARGTVG